MHRSSAMNRKKEGKQQVPPGLPRAASRLLGSWFGMFALALTYLSGVLSGTTAPTALMRAAIAWAAFATLGRVIGWFVGRSFEASLREVSVDGGEPEAGA